MLNCKTCSTNKLKARLSLLVRRHFPPRAVRSRSYGASQGLCPEWHYIPCFGPASSERASMWQERDEIWCVRLSFLRLQLRPSCSHGRCTKITVRPRSAGSSKQEKTMPKSKLKPKPVTTDRRYECRHCGGRFLAFGGPFIYCGNCDPKGEGKVTQPLVKLRG